MPKEIETKINEETPAQASLTPRPTTRPELISAMVAMMTNASVDDLSKMLDASLAQIGHEADGIPPDAAARNQASVAARGAMRESVEEIFAGDELSEEFKERAATLFEAHVAQRVVVERAKIEEEADQKIKEEVKRAVDDLTEAVDSYATLAAKTWVEENQVAIDSTLRTELAEEFMGKLKDLFVESWIEIPDDRVDVVEQLAKRVQELEGRLDESVNECLEMKSVIEKVRELSEREEVVSEAAAGLTDVEASKLQELSEGLAYEDKDGFKKKVEVLREQFKAKAGKKLEMGEKPIADVPQSLVEGKDETVLAEEAEVDPVMSAYDRAIARLSTYSASRG